MLHVRAGRGVMPVGAMAMNALRAGPVGLAGGIVNRVHIQVVKGRSEPDAQRVTVAGSDEMHHGGGRNVVLVVVPEPRPFYIAAR